MDSLTYLQLLRSNRSFRRLWWGQVISELGNWFNFIAGLGLVRVVSNGDAGRDHDHCCSRGWCRSRCLRRSPAHLSIAGRGAR